MVTDSWHRLTVKTHFWDLSCLDTPEKKFKWGRIFYVENLQTQENNKAGQNSQPYAVLYENVVPCKAACVFVLKVKKTIHSMIQATERRDTVVTKHSKVIHQDFLSLNMKNSIKKDSVFVLDCGLRELFALKVWYILLTKGLRASSGQENSIMWIPDVTGC